MLQDVCVAGFLYTDRHTQTHTETQSERQRERRNASLSLSVTRGRWKKERKDSIEIFQCSSLASSYNIVCKPIKDTFFI